jgi:alkylated DNA repair dioxygenase AlkB
VSDTPIVTVSFGETRVFRLTLEKTAVIDGKKKRVVEKELNFAAPAGTVFVMPYRTNLVWKHGVPKSARYTGRRISVTFRGFEPAGQVEKSRKRVRAD